MFFSKETFFGIEPYAICQNKDYEEQLKIENENNLGHLAIIFSDSTKMRKIGLGGFRSF